MIKAIETSYKGYRFRSRLEARWAVFFDELGLRWNYEPEGFELPCGTKYLPDFFIEKIGYVEIKPYQGQTPWPITGSKEDLFSDYLCSLESNFQDNWYVICGSPGYAATGDVESPDYSGYTAGDSPYLFCECYECGEIGICFDGRSARVKHKDDCSVLKSSSDKNYNANSSRLLLAAYKARSARFEFGEHGVVK